MGDEHAVNRVTMNVIQPRGNKGGLFVKGQNFKLEPVPQYIQRRCIAEAAALLQIAIFKYNRSTDSKRFIEQRFPRMGGKAAALFGQPNKDMGVSEDHPYRTLYGAMHYIGDALSTPRRSCQRRRTNVSTVR